MVLRFLVFHDANDSVAVRQHGCCSILTSVLAAMGSGGREQLKMRDNVGAVPRGRRGRRISRGGRSRCEYESPSTENRDVCCRNQNDSVSGVHPFFENRPFGLEPFPTEFEIKDESPPRENCSGRCISSKFGREAWCVRSATPPCVEQTAVSAGGVFHLRHLR